MRWLDPRTAPFIPIPEIGTDPNSGTTVGLLGVYLDTDEQHEIRRILAPDIIYNPGLGYGAHFRLFDYPSDDTAWYAVAGAKENVERELDILYSTGIKRREDWSYSVRAVYDRSATDRFFGFGNGSDPANDTNYTKQQLYADGTFGWNATPSLQVALNFRPRQVRIEQGTFESLPSIQTRFPGVPGFGANHEFLSRLLVTYDTRDSPDIPTRGSLLVGYGGFTDRAFFSSVSYSKFGFDARHYEPLGERYVVAGHVAAQYMPVGGGVPFWALSSLGGDRSIPGEREPLRGFGDDRFIDRNLFSAGAELRSRVYEISLFSTDLAIEMAPFVEAGRVFQDIDDNPVRSLHVVGGLGFRAIAKPFIVGYVDFGYGSEGAAVFSGINYPF